MKKILFLLLVPFILLADNGSYERKIYTLILEGIFPHKESIKVWSDVSEKLQIFSQIANIVPVEKQSDADILLLVNKRDIKSKTPKFIQCWVKW